MNVRCAVAIVMLTGLAWGQGFGFEEGLTVTREGVPWMRTITTPLRGEDRESTYKVYTQLYDFEGRAPITKGPGGKYTHHRGMFIGWKDTLVGDQDFDTWHMSNCSQQHVAWLELKSTEAEAVQVEEVRWNTDLEKTFITEFRRIRATADDGGHRVFDFQSKLRSVGGDIQLKGDLQHAGMQIRLANEVSEHEETTEYILPEGAQELDDDKVTGAWWVCCRAEVGGVRYWVMHMTPPTHPYGVPVYSIRRYARFGAFFEPELKAGRQLELNFRILVSNTELAQSDCQALYDAYAAEQGATQ